MATLTATVKAFNELYELMDNVKTVSGQIDDVAENLIRVKDVVSSSVANLAAITEQNAAATEETSASMEVVLDLVNECSKDIGNLLDTSNDLKGHVQKFKL
jgi:methyl-accepting chemotaxis protein